MHDVAALDACIRDYLNQNAVRRMAVLKPLKVVIENYPEGEEELLDAVNNPNVEAAGSRKVPFGRNVYIEADDFMEEPPKKFFRLAPGREVRLRYAYFITCTNVVKDDAGNVTELRCTYDRETRGGSAPDGRKVKATLHWVSADHGLEAEVRLYDHLFAAEEPGTNGEFVDDLNPQSLEVLNGCKLEPGLGDLGPGETVQFERLGYFCADSNDKVFNRTLSLRDNWAKVEAKG